MSDSSPLIFARCSRNIRPKQPTPGQNGHSRHVDDGTCVHVYARVCTCAWWVPQGGMCTVPSPYIHAHLHTSAHICAPNRTFCPIYVHTRPPLYMSSLAAPAQPCPTLCPPCPTVSYLVVTCPMSALPCHVMTCDPGVVKPRSGGGSESL
jgi:hypothetical protein